ncbi:YbaB/EbfC DNA-binding family protein [Nocardia amikacinitolerans]|uniref:YbaB/EbfC family nucleoid-associated protein n=1 Tax=Nocardia amikacinitolerans TaxID=756689 RepID=UPI000834C1FD|nr:YbaB/EbfC family nucleoid-associated protein [Nocardia amikacinitolerans]MCP2319566.1 YbaB/EbfC DNA-binding family protein [Nocardia amikacinitolerans]
MSSGDARAAVDQLVSWADNLERTAQKYQDLHHRMAAVSVTETSADKRISVTIDSSGATTAISLAPPVRGTDPATVAAELMGCTRRAQARLRAQVTDLVHSVVGDDAAGQGIVNQYVERFPDPSPGPVTPAQPAAPDFPTYMPTFGAQPPADEQPPRQGTRGPDRNHVVTPDEPDEEDLYYQRKSWLE